MYYVDILVGGLAMGCLYAVATVGLTLAYGVLRILHVAHAAVFTLGALIGVSVANASGSAVLGFIIASTMSAMAGAVIYRLVYAPLLGRPPYIPLVASIGVLIVMTDGFRLVFGEGGTALSSNIFFLKGIDIGNVRLALVQIVIASVAITAFAGLAVFVRTTRTGVVWRATVSKPAIASAFGVNVRSIYYMVFGLGSALAGIAGLLTAYLNNLAEPELGELIGYKALAIIVLGGLGSIQGAFVASLALGVTEAFGALAFGDYLDRNAIAAVVLIVVLVARPSGFGRDGVAA